MKRLAFLTGILALATPLAMAQYSTWASDPAHSEVDFSIKHGGVSNVHGRFGKVAATLVYNEADVTKSTVTASFTSTNVTKNGNKLTVSGNFTLHGVTRPVVLDVDGPSSPLENGMDHKLHSGFSASTTISRTAYGIGTAFPSALVGDDVKLTIELEIIKQEVKQ